MAAALSKAGMVFSGKQELSPRWASTTGMVTTLFFTKTSKGDYILFILVGEQKKKAG